MRQHKLGSNNSRKTAIDWIVYRFSVSVAQTVTREYVLGRFPSWGSDGSLTGAGFALHRGFIGVFFETRVIGLPVGCLVGCHRKALARKRSRNTSITTTLVDHIW